MVHIITATYSEAKYIIEYYKLKKLLFIKEFQIFYNQKLFISLTIAGIGKVSAAAAVSYTFSLFNKKKNDSWINIGIAGHENAEIGEIFLIKKIIDNSTMKNWFPSITFDLGIKKNICKTYDKPNFAYSEILYDMELSGFYEISSKFSTNELIHSLKIVSDNKSEKKFNKIEIFHLVEKNIETINLLYLKMKKLLLDINQINEFNPLKI